MSMPDRGLLESPRFYVGKNDEELDLYETKAKDKNKAKGKNKSKGKK